MNDVQKAKNNNGLELKKIGPLGLVALAFHEIGVEVRRDIGAVVDNVEHFFSSSKVEIPESLLEYCRDEKNFTEVIGHKKIVLPSDTPDTPTSDNEFQMN